jgi:hypothetical protein
MSPEAEVHNLCVKEFSRSLLDKSRFIHQQEAEIIALG